MRMWPSIVLLFGISACGGASPHSAAPAPESPAVVELRAAADGVCKCTEGDDTCAQAALEKLLTREADLANPIDQTALDTEHDRAIECYAREAHVPRAAELVPVMEKAADEVCACADEACAHAAVDRLREALHAKQDAVFTTADQAALEKAGDRLQKCAARFGAAAPVPGPSAP
jgi:hypothetical protein